MLKFRSLVTDKNLSTEFELKNLLSSKISDYLYITHKIEFGTVDLSNEILELISDYLVLDSDTIISVKYNPLISKLVIESNNKELEDYLRSLDISYGF